ncbi:MAG: ABC transporter permease, partial [Acidobacteriota bacterium]
MASPSKPDLATLAGELGRLAIGALIGHRLRSALSMLGIAVGVASVILLTSIGEGTRVYLLGQFTQFGTNLIVVNPGKSKTLGVPGVFGGTTHPLSLADATALARLPEIEVAMPLAFGQARVEAAGRGRSVLVYGVTPDLPRIWEYRVRQGSFWPRGDLERASAHAVLGPSLKRELFDQRNALGEFVRIAGRRFRVIGIMEAKGRFLGIDLGDTAFVPVASAMQMFNLSELTEIDVLYPSTSNAARAEVVVREHLIERHDGDEDFTITSQDAMLDVAGNIMGIITMAVGAIAGISLLVGAVGILTMMWIAVGERTGEIGLLRAIGATRGQVSGLFLVEAAMLAMLGGLIGAAVGLGITGLLRLAVPGLPLDVPLPYVAAALGV